MAQLHLKALKHSAVVLPFAFNLGTTELDLCCRYQRRDRQKQTEGFFFSSCTASFDSLWHSGSMESGPRGVRGEGAESQQECSTSS